MMIFKKILKDTNSTSYSLENLPYITYELYKKEQIFSVLTNYFYFVFPDLFYFYI